MSSATWTWRCLACGTTAAVARLTPPRCGCTEPYFVSVGGAPHDPSETTGPCADGDGEDRVLYLVDRYGGRLVGRPARPGGPVTFACWRPPRDGEERVSWQTALGIAYSEFYAVVEVK